jgi:putative DNA primase/helicase
MTSSWTSSGFWASEMATNRDGSQGGERVVPPPNDPAAIARQFVADRYRDIGGVLALRHHRGAFHRFVGDHWPEDDEDRLRSELWPWLEEAVYEREGELVPFRPTPYRVANVLAALKAMGHLERTVQPPAWICDIEPSDPDGERSLVPLANGLLDLASRQLRPHSPEFFCGYVLPFAFDPDAPPPARWLRFLDDLWGDDEESKATLAEWFGYVLSGDTSQQKMLLAVGPKRSGKGTTARVLTGLLGVHNAAGPTLASLTQNFGLQPLIGKPLAIISDARLGKRMDATVAVERLLSISGEDTITIDRKYRDPFTGKLPTRIMVLTNELPRFTDASGALASRFVLVTMRESFYGRENPQLTDELLADSSAIFNWALAGLDRLRERGYFAIPEAAREALRHLEDLASPVGAFVRERCELGSAYSATTDELWTAWKEWCIEEGAHHSTKAVFARDLRSSVADLAPVRFRNGETRRSAYRGIKLAQQSSGPLTTPDHGDDTAPHANTQLDRGGQGWSGFQPTVPELHRIGDARYLEWLWPRFEAGLLTPGEWQRASRAHRLLARRTAATRNRASNG